MDLTLPVSEVTFVAIDFETTGLYPTSDRICEFGAVRFHAGTIVGEFERLANPGIPISAEAAAVSGITDEKVANEPAVDEVVPEFVSFIGDAVIMAHNAPFDVGFLRAAVSSLGLGEISNPIVDTQTLAIKAFPKRKSYGLQNLAAELGLPPNRAHRALDDAIMCMRLFGQCVDELAFMGELELKEVLA